MNWKQLGEFALKLIAALALSLSIPGEQEKSTRMMGLRTFPLVAVASCAYILVGEAVFGNSDDALARSILGSIGGRGFIGGGAILKKGSRGGSATLVRVWTTGA